jgi:enoyl-CoA hydratase/carnithine racemase
MTGARSGEVERYGEVTVVLDEQFVATVEMHRPPENYFDTAVVRSLVDAYRALGQEPGCRAIVLCSEGKHFCAGAHLTGSPGAGAEDDGPDLLYRDAVGLFEAPVPVVAAVQGAAVGAGFALACTADFRVGGPGTRFAANFARFGFHHIMGLTVTLPAIVGQQHAWDLLYTGRRLKGADAAAIGLCDRTTADEGVRGEALALATEMAASAPLAVRSIRRTLRAGLVDRVRAAAEHEAAEQMWLQTTSDWSEGVAAFRESRSPRFAAR